MKVTRTGVMCGFVWVGIVLGDMPARTLASDQESPPSPAAFFAAEASEVFRLSSGGDRVAFVRSTGQRTVLCVADPARMAETTQEISSASDMRVVSFFWAGDRCLAFEAALASGGTRIACATSSDTVGWGPMVVRTLAEADQRASLAGSIQSRQGAAPEIVLSVPSPQSAEFADLYAVGAETAEWRLLHRSGDGVSVWNVSRSGELLVGIRAIPDGSKELVASHGGDITPLMRCAPGDSLHLAGIHPDDSCAFIVTDSGENAEFGHLESIDIKTGERTLLAQDPKGEVDLYQALFSGDGKRLLGALYLRDRSGYEWICPETEALFKRARELLPPGEIRLGDGSTDGKRWLLTLTRDTAPDAEYHYDAEAHRVVRLDWRKESIEPRWLGRMEPVSYPARDGRKIPGYLTLPSGKGRTGLPLVVFPHGGPNKRNFWGYDPRVQFLASRGYAVFQPNFRGSSGFGKEFERAGDREWGRGVMQDDLTDGVNWLIAEKIADPRRIAILGGSYGGFAALAGVAFTPDLYAVGVCFFGASDLPAFVREIPPTWKPFLGDLNLKIGNPADPVDALRLARQSPIHAISSIKVPLLVYHGAKDQTVRIAQAHRFVAACRSQGVSVDYLVALNEGHGFSDPGNEQAVYLAVERVLAEHLRGSASEVVPSAIENRLAELRANGGH